MSGQKKLEFINHTLEWLKPSAEAINHRKIAAIYTYTDDYGDKNIDLDIFGYDPLNGVFIGRSGRPRLKLKDLDYWYPLPDIPEGFRGANMPDMDELKLEINQMLKSNGLGNRIDGIRCTEGVWEIAIESAYGDLIWIHLAQSPIIVEQYVRSAVKMGLL